MYILYMHKASLDWCEYTISYFILLCKTNTNFSCFCACMYTYICIHVCELYMPMWKGTVVHACLHAHEDQGTIFVLF